MFETLDAVRNDIAQRLTRRASDRKSAFHCPVVATADADAFTIEGRSISRTPMDVLLKARALFAELVRRERGGATIATTRVQFT